MTTKNIIRDKDGNVINIGDWDYDIRKVQDDVTGEFSDVVYNPLPGGAVSAIEEVEQTSDGGWRVVS